MVDDMTFLNAWHAGVEPICQLTESQASWFDHLERHPRVSEVEGVPALMFRSLYEDVLRLGPSSAQVEGLHDSIMKYFEFADGSEKRRAVDRAHKNLGDALMERSSFEFFFISPKDIELSQVLYRSASEFYNERHPLRYRLDPPFGWVFVRWITKFYGFARGPYLEAHQVTPEIRAAVEEFDATLKQLWD